MVGTSIQEFLNDRNKTLEDWLPGAAKRARQLSFCTHPPKFSHPNAKITLLQAEAERRPEGFLRTGNVAVNMDVVGNAASLDVHKFLSLVLQDGKTVLQHLEEDSDTIQQQLSIGTATYSDIRKGLLEIHQIEESAPKTHGGVKQVYFPLNNPENNEPDYHLLSILTPSGILYELKNRIRTMRFSDQAKASREARKKNELADDFSDVINLTSIGYGGTKPQNISALNNQNGGVAWLLPSLPPVLISRSLNPPRNSFFDSRYTQVMQYQKMFEALHSTLRLDINNIHIRQRIKGQIKAILAEIIDRSWKVRYLEPGWSNSDRYQNLPKAQKIWLDQQYREQRQQETDWLDTIKTGFVRWFTDGYQTLQGEAALPLSDYEFIEIRQWMDEMEEGLK